MSRLLADENFPLPTVQELRRLGHDKAVLYLAIAENRAVLTLNRKHFVRLDQAVPEHTGIIACTLDLDYVGQANRIDHAIKARITLEGLLIRINRPG